MKMTPRGAIGVAASAVLEQGAGAETSGERQMVRIPEAELEMCFA